MYIIVNENGMFLKYYGVFLVFDTLQEARSLIFKFSLTDVKIKPYTMNNFFKTVNFKEVKDEFMK